MNGLATKTPTGATIEFVEERPDGSLIAFDWPIIAEPAGLDATMNELSIERLTEWVEIDDGDVVAHVWLYRRVTLRARSPRQETFEGTDQQ